MIHTLSESVATFFTDIIGNWTVTPSSWCVTLAFLYRNPMGLFEELANEES
jgi:hypothetical protein